MSDPLAEIVTLLQPQAPFSKLVRSSGAWRVRRTNVDQVYYCLILTGQACLEVNGKPPLTLKQGDFALIPEAYSFAMSSVTPKPDDDLETVPAQQDDGTYRLGDPNGPVDTQQLIGFCVFGAPDASLLVSLLPDVIVIRGQSRIRTLAKLVGDEARANRPARDILLERLLEALLIETLRSVPETTASPGLLKGLSDERLNIALRCMHAKPDQNWSVAELAKQAGLSRSAFFVRFNKTVGIAPMDYLLQWRMTLAKQMLRQTKCGVAEVASKVGYGSASAFSVAFSRHTGFPPAQYGRQTDLVAPNEPAGPI
ncbi:AraC family transcriptional regulator [Thalassospira mesophila]|uniref:AraC family transcriptional regulator n=1 Tax=Thalassospira mesophila TaxID=1293891 RepID=A0A1Y2L4W5_9PROT|nr:AraC family transcriptional regulator [Thalassospira mesophila]OSQ39583.1 AraC family transcriptional regulator [Thalassospira mesophila]